MRKKQKRREIVELDVTVVMCIWLKSVGNMELD